MENVQQNIDLSNLLNSIFNIKINIEPEYLQILYSELNLDTYQHIFDNPDNARDYCKQLLQNVINELTKKIGLVKKGKDVSLNKILNNVANDPKVAGALKAVIYRDYDYSDTNNFNLDSVDIFNNLSDFNDLIKRLNSVVNYESLGNIFIDKLQKQIGSNFSMQLFASFIETIKSSFFSPYCTTMNDVFMYTGLYDNITDNNIKQIKEKILGTVKSELEFIEERQSDVYKEIEEIKSICKNYYKLFDIVKKYVDLEKISDAKTRNIISIISSMQTKAQEILRLVYDIQKQKQIPEIQKLLKEKPDNIPIEQLHEITNKLFQLINSVNVFYIFQLIYDDYKKDINAFFENSINQEEIDFDDLVIIDDIKQKDISKIQNTFSSLWLNRYSICYSQLLVDSLAKQDYTKAVLLFNEYRSLIYNILQSKGYDIGKFYPPIDYIKQHFGDDKDIVKNMVNQYIQQTTVFLKSIMPTFKYPVNLLTFDSLLEYQKLIGDSSVLTPDRINQLRSQIVQVIDFMNVNNLSMTDTVTEKQIEKIINNNMLEGNMFNLFNSHMLSKIINATVQLYNQRVNSKFNQKKVNEVELDDKNIQVLQNYGFDKKQVKQIVKDFDEKQIEQIILGIKNGLDIDIYFNKNYSYDVMSIARTDLSLGVPKELIELYLKFYSDMAEHLKIKKLRVGLLPELHSSIASVNSLINDIYCIKDRYFNGLSIDELKVAVQIKTALLQNNPPVRIVLSDIIDSFSQIKQDGIDVVSYEDNLISAYQQYIVDKNRKIQKLDSDDIEQINKNFITKLKVNNVFKNMQKQDKDANNKVCLDSFKI